MSSQYPILDNRPIDQWKVTELKEELKRRKLTTKGLKDDLIRRLGEVLRIERENAAKEANNDLNLDPQCEVGVENVEEAAASVMDAIVNKNKVDDDVVQVDIYNKVEPNFQGEHREGDITSGADSSMVEEELTAHAKGVETSITVTESVVSKIGSSENTVQISETQEVNVNSNIQLENEGLKPAYQDVMLVSSAPNNQVSEVSPNLGFQVQSDSVSTDSGSSNENIEPKDNIIADDVKLELDLKPEMLEPSSSNVVPVVGKSHPIDVVETQVKKASVEEKDDCNAADADISKKNHTVCVGDSEKLNLDRSSGDDSMEEDVLESKQVDLKYNSDEVGYASEKSELPHAKAENLVDIVANDSFANQKEIHVEHEFHPTVPAEKRKLNDQEAVNTEPLKRQRRWNSGSINVPEQQSSNLTPTTIPKDALQPMPLKHNFSQSYSLVIDDKPKERVVPPSQNPPTSSLRIDRFLRPFTLKAVQELLGKTGTVTSFWMDHIKTHCYVAYSSVEEAVVTRNAVYNLQWPPNGGRLLVAEFVDPQEVNMRVEAPQSPAMPITPAIAPALPVKQVQPSSSQQVSRQQLPPKTPLQPRPPPSNLPLVKERLAHPPSPPALERHDPPIVTLDDLFCKTKATPRVYYLPLSEEEVAAKLTERGRNIKLSAGVAYRKELFQLSRGMSDGECGFFGDCFMLRLEFYLVLGTFELSSLY